MLLDSSSVRRRAAWAVIGGRCGLEGPEGPASEEEIERQWGREGRTEGELIPLADPDRERWRGWRQRGVGVRIGRSAIGVAGGPWEETTGT